jgi:FAD/FMN-containing dehydrogenase
MTPIIAISPPPDFRGAFRVDDEARAVYSEAAGIGRALPSAVAVPLDVDDLVALVRWAVREKLALIPRGSGSSMPGGAIGAGVIVDMSRWRSLGAVNVASRTIRVGPGVLRGEVDRAARASGLRFPVDPSSGAFCTVGGMASTNAAGAHSMHFGSMRRWVRALDCVFADGSRAEIRRGTPPPKGIPAIDRFLAIADDMVASEATHPSTHAGVIKDSSGYGIAAYARSRDLVDLLVGAEGTLMCIVELELDLIPVAPFTSSVLGGFARMESAVEAAVRTRASGAVACEMLDKTFLDVAASGGAPRQVPPESESALLAEVEGESAEQAAEEARAVEKIFRDAGATTVKIALDQPTETELWELRHAASPILSRLDPNLRSMQFIEDCAVPPEDLPEFVRGVRAILAQHDTRGVIFGHAGDSHAHVNPLVDVGRPGWGERVEAILDAVTTLTASLGGTLTGEHGDGRLRTPLLARVWPESARSHFRAIKAAFDPDGVLNPGVKVPLVGERAIGEIKYDPSLPPLPPRARAALTRVETERAYASFRLELLDGAQ